MAVGHDSDGSRKNGSNVALPGSNVQGNDTICVNLLNREMGDDWGDAQGPDRVPPSGGATDHGDDRETWYPAVEEATESTRLDGLS